jgi:hypothetical protein
MACHEKMKRSCYICGYAEEVEERERVESDISLLNTVNA